MNVRLAVAMFIVATLGTYLVRRIALAHEVLDHPNERSSHVRPTPRGGGVAIVIAAMAAALWLAASHALDWRIALGFVVPGALVAAIGAVDDVRGTSALTRIVVHLVAAVLATWALNTALPASGVSSGWRAVELAIWVVTLTGAINAFNFMDGIDGLAGMEGGVVTLAGAVLLAGSTLAGLSDLSLAISAACFGFLAWNWQPARIFMGDVGSGFVGFALAFLAMASHRAGGPPAYAWALLCGVFLVDATLTLLRRAARGERWWSAHRSHAYQRAAAASDSHARVTLLALLLNACLALLATLAYRGVLPPGVACALAAAGLLGAYGWVERRAPMV